VPLIRVSHASPQDTDQKRTLVRAMTDAYADATGADPAKVWVILEEVSREDWATGGVPLADR
jgi:4-oxalocrotonate tautomerase